MLLEVTDVASVIWVPMCVNVFPMFPDDILYWYGSPSFYLTCPRATTLSLVILAKYYIIGETYESSDAQAKVMDLQFSRSLCSFQWLASQAFSPGTQMGWFCPKRERTDMGERPSSHPSLSHSSGAWLTQEAHLALMMVCRCLISSNLRVMSPVSDFL